MGRRTIFIIIFVVGIVMLAVVGVVFVLQQDDPQPTVEVTADGTPIAVEGGETAVDTEEGALPPQTAPDFEVSSEDLVQVVVSLQTVPRGWVMTEAELTTDFRLATEVGDNVITDLDEVVGKIARTDIYQGQTLTVRDLVEDPTSIGQNTFGPSSLIPDGFVAQAVPLDRLSGVAYGLAEGDTIDIMMSFAFSAIDTEFQTLLLNTANFSIESQPQIGEDGTATGEVSISVVTLDPFGRFEELATGDLVNIQPSEQPGPIIVSLILQNAKVIQVGQWEVPEPVVAPTPTPEPDAIAIGEGDGEGPTPTPTLGADVVPLPTETPSPPQVLLVALSPQQQLLLRYALGVNANIDYALRSITDNQLYSIQNVDLNYLLQQFNIEPPTAYDFTVEEPVKPTPAPAPEAEAPPPGE